MARGTGLATVKWQSSQSALADAGTARQSQSKSAARALCELFRNQPQRVRVPDRLRSIPAGDRLGANAQPAGNRTNPRQASLDGLVRCGQPVRRRTRRNSRTANRGNSARADPRLRARLRAARAPRARPHFGPRFVHQPIRFQQEEVTLMSAQIRPTRLEVSDRFPMLGFNIRTDGPPQRAEVVLASDPSLFGADSKTRRTAANFYSSRAGGPVPVMRGEAMFVVPPEVLARFVGNEKIYFGLATAPEAGGPMEVAVKPSDASPYISLKGLTERSMRRVPVLPHPQQPP